METFLAPIEKPKGPILKLAYAMARRQFGKVLTPLKVVYARLPPAFGIFASKIAKLDKKLTLPPELILLIREQVARLNVCEFCMDIGRSIVVQSSMNEAKFDALGEYRSSQLFSEPERAALDYATELTRQKKVEPDTFARLAQHFSEREICEIDWLVASEHFYNMTNLGLNIHSDMLCDLRKKAKAANGGSMQNAIEKSVELKAPVPRVWEALTDHRQFGQWFRVKIEGPFVPGQVSRGRITHPGYEHLKWEAVIQKMEPGKLFSFTWHPYAVDPKKDYSQETPTLVEFRLEEIPSGTLLKVQESGFDQVPKERRDEAFKMNEGGWGSQMENIKNYLSAKGG